MAITLSAGVSASVSKLPVNNGTETEYGATVKVGSEFMFVRQASASSLTVIRGTRGSTPAAHLINAAVTEVASGGSDTPNVTYLTVETA